MKHLFSIALVVFASIAIGQDIHFSQFNASPLNLNPALAGQFDGDYRFVGNQRTQWKSVTVPYNTIAFSADARNFPSDNIGAGLSIFHDKTGDSQFRTIAVNLAGSYLQPISSDSLQSLSFGIQTGFTQRSINYDALSFDNQYNGYYYDPSLAHNETFANEGRTYLNLNIGVGYFYQIERRKAVGFGVALHNLTKPKQSFFDNDDITLDTRFDIHANVQFPVADKVDVLPSILYRGQGTYKEFLLGGTAKYIMADGLGQYRTVYGGIFARTKDAGYLLMGMDYDQWNVGISYDLNLSNLRPASRGRGGFEISVIYIIKNYKPVRVKHKACPNYI